VASSGDGFVDSSVGIIAAKRCLNKLHEEMGTLGMNEVSDRLLDDYGTDNYGAHVAMLQRLQKVQFHSFNYRYSYAISARIRWPLRAINR